MAEEEPEFMGFDPYHNMRPSFFGRVSQTAKTIATYTIGTRLGRPLTAGAVATGIAWPATGSLIEGALVGAGFGVATLAVQSERIYGSVGKGAIWIWDMPGGSAANKATTLAISIGLSVAGLAVGASHPGLLDMADWSWGREIVGVLGLGLGVAAADAAIVIKDGVRARANGAPNGGIVAGGHKLSKVVGFGVAGITAAALYRHDCFPRDPVGLPLDVLYGCVAGGVAKFGIIDAFLPPGLFRTPFRLAIAVGISYLALSGYHKLNVNSVVTNQNLDNTREWVNEFRRWIGDPNTPAPPKEGVLPVGAPAQTMRTTVDYPVFNTFPSSGHETPAGQIPKGTVVCVRAAVTPDVVGLFLPEGLHFAAGLSPGQRVFGANSGLEKAFGNACHAKASDASRPATSWGRWNPLVLQAG